MVIKSFDLKAWVCISKYFDSFKILKSILEKATLYACDIQNLNLLQTKIRDFDGKKFHLIIYDVWNENYNKWDKLLRVFKCGA